MYINLSSYTVIHVYMIISDIQTFKLNSLNIHMYINLSSYTVIHVYMIISDIHTFKLNSLNIHLYIKLCAPVTKCTTYSYSACLGMH